MALRYRGFFRVVKELHTFAELSILLRAAGDDAVAS